MKGLSSLLHDKSKSLSIKEIDYYYKKSINDSISKEFNESISVKGEVSSISIPRNDYTHQFGKLSEGKIHINCFFPKKYKLEVGDYGLFMGTLETYFPTNKVENLLRLKVIRYESEGKGKNFMQNEEYSNELSFEMHQTNKREFPHKKKLFFNVALISSIGSEGYNDFTNKIKTSSIRDHVNIIDFHCKLNNHKNIASNIISANNSNVDILAIVRGGGDRLDFEPFQKKEVVDAIKNSEKFVITGLGHDTDFHNSDIVSDKSASVPNDAAVFLINQIVLQLKKLNAPLSVFDEVPMTKTFVETEVQNKEPLVMSDIEESEKNLENFLNEMTFADAKNKKSNKRYYLYYVLLGFVIVISLYYFLSLY